MTDLRAQKFDKKLILDPKVDLKSNKSIVSIIVSTYDLICSHSMALSE